jgi:integrase
MRTAYGLAAPTRAPPRPPNAGDRGDREYGICRREEAEAAAPEDDQRDEAARCSPPRTLRAPTGLRNRCILELMYRAGLRVGEVLALEPRDVDLSPGPSASSTARAATAPATSTTPCRPGSSSGSASAAHYARKGSPLFCTLKGGPVSVRYVEAMVKRMAKRAGVTSTVTPHVLRHTFATELLDEGANIRQVQEALRHADVSTTMIYTHVLDTQLRSIIRKRKRGGAGAAWAMCRGRRGGSRIRRRSVASLLWGGASGASGRCRCCGAGSVGRCCAGRGRSGSCVAAL